MSLLISSHAITKSYGSQNLFKNISLGFMDKERLGLIGPNGSGKSTLLKILCGIEIPDEGKITLKHGTHLVYLSQEDELDPILTIRQTLESPFETPLGETELYTRMRSYYKQNLFPDMDQPVSTLSGGWRKRLVILRALIQQADILFLDEPTNHLDLEGIVWLEDILRKAQFAFVLVSHDRYFLEKTSSSMVELNPKYPEGYFKVKGNYSNFLQKRADYFLEQSKQEAVLSNQSQTFIRRQNQI